MYRAALLLVVVIPFTACQQQQSSDLPVFGGVLAGYNYSETPVVEEETDIGYGYTLNFIAYDLGSEARFVAYAEKTKAGGYYNGMVRLAIQDPDGNAYTEYRNHDTEPVDTPIVWKPSTTGTHDVTVSLKLYNVNEKSMSFEVPLNRQPVSPFLIGGIIAVVVIFLSIVGITLRRRQQPA